MDKKKKKIPRNKEVKDKPQKKDYQKLFEEVCESLKCSNIGIRKACDKLGISTEMFYKKLNENEENAQRYARAKELQIEILANEIIELSDDKSEDYTQGEFGKVGNSTAVQRSKLQMEARKWLLSKLAPKKYGDKIDVTTNGDNINSVAIINIDPLDDSSDDKS